MQIYLRLQTMHQDGPLQNLYMMNMAITGDTGRGMAPMTHGTLLPQLWRQTIENPIYQNNINLFLNFKPAKGLSLKIMGGGTFSNYYNANYQNTKTRDGYAMNGVGTISNSFSNRLSEYQYPYI